MALHSSATGLCVPRCARLNASSSSVRTCFVRPSGGMKRCCACVGVRVGVWARGYVGVGVCGCVGVQVWVCVGMWVCGCVGVCAWVWGCVGAWVSGCVGVGLCGCRVVWVCGCGCVGVWVCGCVGVWVCGQPCVEGQYKNSWYDPATVLKARSVSKKYLESCQPEVFLSWLRAGI